MHVSNEALKIIEHMYDTEATDAIIYAKLAQKTKSEKNKELLLRMSRDEEQHRDLWHHYIKREAKPHKFHIWLYTKLAAIFGLVFAINLMESGEDKAVATYTKLAHEIPVALKVLQDEQRHEDELINMIEQKGLTYISSIVLGLNDALVELTGALAGFTLALNNNTMIGLAGFITGVAATLSMAASEYLAKKADTTEKHPLLAATYTGLAYLFTVTLLLLPYAILSSPLSALAMCLCNAALIIAGFTYFVSVVRKTSFLRGFGEMVGISFAVAFISFMIGWAARIFLEIDL